MAEVDDSLFRVLTDTDVIGLKRILDTPEIPFDYNQFELWFHRDLKESLLDIIFAHPKFDVNHQYSPYLETLLHFACINHQLPLLERLLELPQIDVNVKDCDDETPLYICCSWRMNDYSRLLLAHPNIDVNKGKSITLRAIWLNNDELLLALFDREETEIEATDSDGNSVLTEICRRPQETLWLERYLAHPKTKLEFAGGANPLHIASFHGYFKAIKLIMKDERLTAENLNHSCPPIFYAIKHNANLEIIQFMLCDPRMGMKFDDKDDPLNYFGGYDPLEYACRHKNDKATRECLLKGGFDVKEAYALATNPKNPECMLMLVALEPEDLYLFVHHLNSDGLARTIGNEFAKEFVQDHIQKAFELQCKPNLNRILASQLFCMINCLCDDYFTLNPSQKVAHRFFSIASQLPLELQMVLCNRAYRIMKRDNIPIGELNPGYIRLFSYWSQ